MNFRVGRRPSDGVPLPSMSSPPTLDESYRLCKELHRAHGTTYYYATMTLPAVKRPHVHAIYGLCRYADEIVDAFDNEPVEARRARLAEFEADLLAGIDVGHSTHPVLKAVVFTIHAYRMPTDAFVRFFASMSSDLDVSSYASYNDLLGYMDGSAAVIGEMMLPILEPRDDRAIIGARDLGIAFQLTNFLRDVGEDLDRGRVYFPQDELDHFGADIWSRQVDDAWRSFCRFQIDRMNELYATADEGITMLPPSSARAIRTARVLYSEILDHVVANDYDVFSQRARVPLRRKLTVAAQNLRQS